MKARHQIIITFKDWETTKYKGLEWEQSVEIVRWECNYEKKIYIIDFNSKPE